MNISIKSLAVSGVLLLGAVSAPAVEPKPVVQPSVKLKTLVVFYSRTGHTKQVAGDIVRLLGADVEELVDKKDRSGMLGYIKAGRDASKETLADLEPVKIDPAAYDLVIMGAPIWNWNMTPALRAYITANKAVFKNVAFFTLSGSTKPDKIVKKMEVLSGKTARASTGFFDSDLKVKNRAAYEAKLKAFADKLK